MPDPTAPLILEPIAGPNTETIEASPDASTILGRSSTASVQLHDPTISRRHTKIAVQGGRWLVTDLESRHGTFLNADRLDPNRPELLSGGDLLRVGPWTFRVGGAETILGVVNTQDDLASTLRDVQTVSPIELQEIKRQRFELIIECAGAITAAGTNAELAAAIIDAAHRGTGYAHVAVARQLKSTGQIELLGYSGPDGTEPEKGFAISRALLAAASNGDVVRLDRGSQTVRSETIDNLGIRGALCAPIMLGESVEAYLYLDSRESDPPPESDATGFCLALARIGGMAMASLKREELERHRTQLEGDLRAAREAQRRLMPPATGRMPGLEFAIRTRPGRLVAGDLVDIFPLDAHRTVLLLGDVVGKGVGAAILMASTQSFIRAACANCDDPGEIVQQANEHLCAHIARGGFISLWLGIADNRDDSLRFIDAGHGHWLLTNADGATERVDSEGGLPLGVDEGARYTSERRDFRPGEKLVVFSDGLVEQSDDEGVLFGMDRVIRIVGTHPTPDAEARALSDAVREHAGTDELADDLTIACIFRSDG